jgi:hypothetical protein
LNSDNPRRGVLIELEDGEHAIVYCDEDPIQGRYTAHIVNSKDKPTGQTRLISGKVKIKGFLN